jgi:hypothetical protein
LLALLNYFGRVMTDMAFMFPLNKGGKIPQILEGCSM